MIKKRKVVIVGAGNVGASTAFCMINQGICDEIVLIDMNTERAKGETLDAFLAGERAARRTVNKPTTIPAIILG